MNQVRRDFRREKEKFPNCPDLRRTTKVGRTEGPQTVSHYKGSQNEAFISQRNGELFPPGVA